MQLVPYLLGVVGVLGVVARLATAREQPPPGGAAGRRAAALTLAMAVAAIALLARVPPVSAVLDALLRPDSAWLVADTLWLVAGFLALLWVDPIVQPAPTGAPEWDPLHALGRPRTLSILLIAAALWIAAWRHPEAWSALQDGIPLRVRLGLLPLAYLFYQGYLFALTVFFGHALWRQRAVAESRAAYLRISLGLLAGVIYLAAPALQCTAVVVLWRTPLDATWPAFLPIVQVAQLVSGILALPVIAPRYLERFLFASLVVRERRQAQAQLERFHNWLAACRPAMVLPAPTGSERETHPLAEIERAARYALAYAPAGTRARLAELGENRIYVAGRYGRGAEPAALLLSQALRAWQHDHMPAELPRFRFIGDDAALLIYWGWVAALVMDDKATG